MIQQNSIPKDNKLNLTLMIPKKPVVKPKKLNNSIQKSENNYEMSQEEFVKWIEEAENSPTMSLETFNERWEIEIQRIKNLIV